MARITVDLSHVPMHLCLALFHMSSLYSGQEKSTRYQTMFRKAVLHPIKNYLPEHLPKEEIALLEEEYQSFGIISLDLFSKYRPLLSRAFEQYYQVDVADSRQKSALMVRVLDCTRYFLLIGQQNSMSFETSARDWSRILGDLKASPLSYYHKVALQIEKLLAPTREEEEVLGYKAEAPGLLRHTNPHITTNTNLRTLKRFLEEKTNLLKEVRIDRNFPRHVKQQVTMIESVYTEGDRLVASYILMIWPGIERKQLFKWIHSQTDETKHVISTILFSDHTSHSELPGFGRTTRMSLVIESFLGELRDLNRHRAWGRFLPLPLIFGEQVTKNTAQQIINRGFGLPLYLTSIAELEGYKVEYEQDLAAYYQELQKFLDKTSEKYRDTIDYSFILNLLPLAHQVDLWMHGDPKQASYFTSQRSRPGGHINYRILAYEANQLLATSDPYFSAMRLVKKPDPASREEFLDRS